MMLSTGERIACALVAMAIDDLGEERRLVHRLAGRDPHRRDAHARQDPRDPRRPHPDCARRGADRARRRLPGVLARHDGDHDARPRRDRRDRRRPRRGARRRVRDLLRRRRASSRPIRGSCPKRASSPSISYDEMLEMAASGAKVLDAPLGRARAQPRCADPRALDVHRRGGNLGAGDRNGAGDHLGGHPLGDGRRLHADRDPRPAGRRGPDLRGRRVRAGERRHDHPERRPRPRGDVVLGARRGRRRDPRRDRDAAGRAGGVRRRRSTTSSARSR